MATGLPSRRRRYLIFKVWALLSLVRWYSVLIVAVALYLSACYLFNPGIPKAKVFFDIGLHIEVLALSLFIMSGFIINAFYDVEKDLINRPHRTVIDRHISRRFSLNCYFAFIILAAILSLFTGWKVFLVNLLFSAVLWAYSHKLQNKRFIGEMGAALLTVAPFFSLALYYENVTWRMLEFIALMFIVLIEREFLKRIMAVKGDFVLGHRSIPVTFGERKAAVNVLFLSVISIAQLSFFLRFLHHGAPAVTFVVMIALQALAIGLWLLKKDYGRMDSVLKAIIVLMVVSIPFI